MDAELTPEREDELVQQMLYERVGIDPSQLSPVLNLVALGLVNSAWRNTAVENWHAEGRILDGEMMRINSHSTWRVHQILTRWRAGMKLLPDAPTESLDMIEFDDFRWLGGRVYRWIVNPRRRLPTGQLLADVARDGLADLERDADRALTAFVYQAEERGGAFSFRRAAHGGLACRHWWGHPAWPGLVDRFITALDNPEDPHWGDGGEFRARLRSEPPMVRSRPLLHRVLLRGPWDLDFVSAQWVVSAGIGRAAASGVESA